jgi:hypothetical protein
MKPVHSSREHEYDLFEELDGSLVLSVLCGTIGLYEARVRLTGEELSRFRTEGVVFLDDLASRIRKEEPGFRERMF